MADNKIEARHQRLRTLMDRYQVDVEVVATILTREVSTVKVWLAPSGTNIPPDSLELLDIKLKALYPDR